ncbi:hypothetical protein [Nocardia sp. NPDC005745]|uniref:DUF7064 domain-containing protein n=1 Tax=Nocardia sp. NPDC005745 TaxID=3157061 RepID=UPI0033FEC3A6
MEPVDLEFTAIRSAEKGFAAFHRQPRGDVPIGHIDQTFHVTGSIQLDKETIAVDCLSNHDHSWSPRAEFRSGCGTFDEFHFGNELTLLAQTVQRTPGAADVTNGYVLVGDDLRRIKKASVEFDQIGYRTKALIYNVTDWTGESYTLTATVASSVTQDQGSNGLTVMNLCEAQWNGRVGVAESMWHWDIPEIQRRIRAARAVPGNEALSTEQALAWNWERHTA